MRLDMRLDMCPDMCPDMRLDMRLDMQLDMRFLTFKVHCSAAWRSQHHPWHAAARGPRRQVGIHGLCLDIWLRHMA